MGSLTLLIGNYHLKGVSALGTGNSFAVVQLLPKFWDIALNCCFPILGRLWMDFGWFRIRFLKRCEQSATVSPVPTANPP